MAVNIIQNGVPRYEVFKMTDTVIEMKKQIYQRIKYTFTDAKEDEERTDEWLNTNLLMNIKDNTPSEKHGSLSEKYGSYSTRKRECEFCGRRHNMRDDVCEVKTDELGSGNSEEGSQKITLRDLYDVIKHERELIFEV